VEIFAVKDQNEEWHCNYCCCKNYRVEVIHPGTKDFKVASAIPKIEVDTKTHF
jgi:hypothetical protein